MSKNIFVTKSFLPSMEEYSEEIKDIWDSHWLTNMGIKHQNLQKELERYLDIKNVQLVTNGHMALELILEAFEVKGEVITTPFTFASTTHAILRKGLTPVFCDINKSDYTIDVSKIEQLINNNTTAIMPVHVYGNICDVETIGNIASKYNLKVIYDAAHAFGVKFKDKGISNYGDASCFSFHATKIFHTIEGGAVCFDNKYRAVGERIAVLKNFGIVGPEDVEAIGLNAKMNEFCAAMGLCNLRHVDDEILARKRIVNRYLYNLKDVVGITLNKEQDNVRSNYAYFPVLIDESEFGVTRDMVFDKLSKNNVYARKYFYPITNSFAAFHGKYDLSKTPIALDISKKVLTLPLYSSLSIEDVDMICDVIISCRS